MATLDKRPKSINRPWQARIRRWGYSVWLGYYQTKHEAELVERLARVDYDKELAREGGLRNGRARYVS